MNIKLILTLLSLILLIGCTNKKEEAEIQLNEIGIKDEFGKKQGIWKQLDNNEGLLTIHFFQDDSMMANLPIDDFQFETLKIDGDRFEMLKPKKWGIDNDSTNLLVLYKKQGLNKTQFKPNIVIREIDRNSVSLDSAFVLAIENLKNSYDNFFVQTTLDVPIDNHPSKYLLFAIKSNDVTLLGSYSLIENGEKFVTINMMGGLYNSHDVYLYKGLFEEIMASFKFKK